MKRILVLLGAQVATFFFMNVSLFFRPLIQSVNLYTSENYYCLWYGLLCLAYVNNLYQIISHIQTGIKFYQRYRNMEISWEPPGAQDEQQSWMFITSSIIDLLGWLWMFYLFDIWNPFYMYLAWTHFAVCFISFFDHDFFQQQYIKSDNVEGKRAQLFLLTRIIFVWTDALARSVISYNYFEYLV